MILITARGQRSHRYPGIPSILDTVVRDATKYFMLITSLHFLSVLFVFFAPEDIELFPPMANTVLVPVMASRLMLSLKKAAVEPEVVRWSIQTMGATSGRPAEDGTIRFASQLPTRHQLLLTPAATGGGDIELCATP